MTTFHEFTSKSGQTLLVNLSTINIVTRFDDPEDYSVSMLRLTCGDYIPIKEPYHEVVSLLTGGTHNGKPSTLSDGAATDANPSPNQSQAV